MEINGREVPVIVFANQKGGVAKTTSADAVADWMRRSGLDVLCVDMDPQGSLGTLERRYVAEGAPNALAFLQGWPVRPVDGQAVVPGELELNIAAAAGADDRWGNPIDEGSLGRAIEGALRTHPFDAVIVDTHPGIGFLEISAAAAADFIIVPTQANRLGAEAVAQMAEFLTMVSESIDVHWRDQPAVLVTLYRGMTRLERGVFEDFRRELPQMGFRVFKRRIPINVAIEQQQIAGESVYATSIMRGAALEYSLVAKTVMEWVGLKPRAEEPAGDLQPETSTATSML